MQLAAAKPFRPSLVLTAKRDVDNGINAPVYRYDRIGAVGGYATASRAIRELGRVTNGAEEGAAVIVHDDGRFYGYTALEGPTWLQGMGYDFIGRPHRFERMHLASGMSLDFRDNSVVAFVDGEIVLRREARD